MVTVCFVGTYPPMVCGIADYTAFITRLGPPGRWAVISFCLDDCEVPLTIGGAAAEGPVWYGIPGLREYSVPVIQEGIRRLGLNRRNAVLWFQHELNIWQDSDAFVAMLKALDLPVIVTFHTLRFQSKETRFGLRRDEYELLVGLLPNVDAVTVFSNGVRSAVGAAFPDHRGKVHVLKHGVHTYPDIARLSYREAKAAFHDFLVRESDLDPETKRVLEREQVFLDPRTVVLGQTGFLHPIKGDEFLYPARDRLQEMLPQHRVVAVRIGRPRLPEHVAHARRLRSQQNSTNKLLFEIWLPEQMLPLAQRAFDANYYWPSDCTQSGMLTHALGAGAVVAGRDLEGVGETLKEAGVLCDADPEGLLLKVRDLVLDPALRQAAQERALEYAAKLSWRNQVRKHYQLAERVRLLRPTRTGQDSVSSTRRQASN